MEQRPEGEPKLGSYLNLTPEQLRDLMDRDAQRLLGLPSQEALQKIRRGEMPNTHATVHLRMLSSLLKDIKAVLSQNLS